MMKQIILLVFLTFSLHSAEDIMLLGQWNSVTYGVNKGTKIKEKEYLKFNADYTFGIVFLVTVKKGNAYVKDLRIEGSGIWKRRENILVVVVQNVEVPVAGEVYGISQASLKSISETFNDKFQNDPIRILSIKEISQHKLVTENKNKQSIVYQRQR